MSGHQSPMMRSSIPAVEADVGHVEADIADVDAAVPDVEADIPDVDAAIPDVVVRLRTRLLQGSFGFWPRRRNHATVLRLFLPQKIARESRGSLRVPTDGAWRDGPATDPRK